jgi:hypothetical protein
LDRELAQIAATDVASVLELCGLAVAAQWLDPVDRFALTYAVAA